MSKQILITGGAGYIGSHAVKLFLQKGYNVIIFDNFSRGYRQVVEILKPLGNLELVEGDLRNKNDIEKVFTNFKIDAVLHFAALCSVDESMKNPGLYFENNTVGSLNLFEAMKQNNVKDIIFSSTCAVYGETQKLPVDENHPTNPANPYGESKLLTEKMLKWYGVSYDFKYVVLRYFNVCGADSEGEIGDSKKPSLLMMQNAVRGVMNIEPFAFTCSKVDTPDGSPIRDYIDVEDLITAHYQAYEYLQTGGKNDIFNLGNGTGYSVKEIVAKTEEVFGIKIPEKYSEPRKGEYSAIYADPQKAMKTLKWQPKKSLQDSILSLKKWYTKYPNGYTS